jgi:hypothetical protein
MKILNKKMTAVAALFVRSSVKISLVAPVMVVAAIIIVVMTALQVESLVRDGAKNLVQASVAKTAATIVKTPISNVQYADMAAVLTRLNPSVVITPSTKGSGLIISVARPELQPEWVYVLSTLQSHRPGVIWEADLLCMKTCTGGAAASAELHGYTQAVRL